MDLSTVSLITLGVLSDSLSATTKCVLVFSTTCAAVGTYIAGNSYAAGLLFGVTTAVSAPVAGMIAGALVGAVAGGALAFSVSNLPTEKQVEASVTVGGILGTLATITCEFAAVASLCIYSYKHRDDTNLTAFKGFALAVSSIVAGETLAGVTKTLFGSSDHSDHH